jgi:hypothetical protein
LILLVLGGDLRESGAQGVCGGHRVGGGKGAVGVGLLNTDVECTGAVSTKPEIQYLRIFFIDHPVMVNNSKQLNLLFDMV